MKSPLANCLVNCGIAAVLLTLSACTNDAYDKGEGSYSLMQAEMADIHVGSDLKADYFVTDDDEKFTVATPFTTNWMKTADSTYRAMTYFSKQGDGMAEVEGFNRVGVITPKRQKDLKTDPVRFESAWMSRGGQYLNACIYLLQGSTSDEKAIQTLGCHIDTLRRNADGTKTMQLTLFHDQGGVPEYYSQRTFVSIPLANATTDSVCLTINTYEGVIRKTFKFPSAKGGKREAQ